MYNLKMPALALLSNDIRTFYVYSFYECFINFGIFIGKVNKSIEISPTACAFVITIKAKLNEDKKDKKKNVIDSSSVFQ